MDFLPKPLTESISGVALPVSPDWRSLKPPQDPGKNRPFWDASGWSAKAESGDSSTTFRTGHPFALIGRNPHCDFCLDDDHATEFAYLVVSFPDWIEAWPIRPLAFSLWGRIAPETRLLVGETHIGLMHGLVDRPQWDPRAVDAATAAMLPTDPVGLAPESRYHGLLEYDAGTESSAPLRLVNGENRAAQTKSVLAIIADGKVDTPKFRDGVTVVGAGHPSMMRIPGKGLKRCDHALVVKHGRAWMIELDVERLAAGEPKISELVVGDAPVHRGGIALVHTQQDEVPGLVRAMSRRVVTKSTPSLQTHPSTESENTLDTGTDLGAELGTELWLDDDSDGDSSGCVAEAPDNPRESDAGVPNAQLSLLRLDDSEQPTETDPPQETGQPEESGPLEETGPPRGTQRSEAIVTDSDLASPLPTTKKTSIDAVVEPVIGSQITDTDLTALMTDRLVATGNQKSDLRRTLVMAFLSFLVTFCGLLTAMVVTEGIWPVLASAWL